MDENKSNAANRIARPRDQDRRETLLRHLSISDETFPRYRVPRGRVNPRWTTSASRPRPNTAVEYYAGAVVITEVCASALSSAPRKIVEGLVRKGPKQRNFRAYIYSGRGRGEGGGETTRTFRVHGRCTSYASSVPSSSAHASRHVAGPLYFENSAFLPLPAGIMPLPVSFRRIIRGQSPSSRTREEERRGEGKEGRCRDGDEREECVASRRHGRAGRETMSGGGGEGGDITFFVNAKETHF